jgi:hypothetical protein
MANQDEHVGIVRGDRLTWFGWMDRELDREHLPEIAENIGLSA